MSAPPSPQLDTSDSRSSPYPLNPALRQTVSASARCVNGRKSRARFAVRPAECNLRAKQPGAKMPGSDKRAAAIGLALAMWLCACTETETAGEPPATGNPPAAAEVAPGPVALAPSMSGPPAAPPKAAQRE